MTDILSEILRAVAGGGYGSSSDGFKSALERQQSLALGKRTMGPTLDMLERRASARVDAMGMNPYSVQGQAAAKLLSSAYNFFPDIVGSMIGVPDSSAYYRQIANGSRGIQMAAAGRVGSILDPYSTRMSTLQAMSLADKVHGIAIGGSGYNVRFTNGLNMDEVGMVAQRVLSSDFMYKGRDGDRLDTASAEFKDKLEKLGAKFNAAASSLAKVTGSVSEALRFMDRMAGGNFLGGTEKQASRIADRARSMAAAIRVTSAMSGMSPQEMYGNMTSLQQAMASRYGVNPAIAAASGFSDMMMNPAFMATMSYGVWAANNPNANQTQKSQALLATQFRASSWANSSAENMTAVVSYLARQGMFSEEQISEIESKLRAGRSNEVVDLVKSVVGEDVYHEIMSDPAAMMASRLNGDKGVYERLGQAGAEGNLREAAIGGTIRLTNWALDRTDEQFDRYTGRSRNRQQDREIASAEALRSLARRKYDLEGGDDWDTDRLRNYLMQSGADMDEVDATQYQAEIDSQMEAVKKNTLGGKRLEAANQALLKEIDNSAMSASEKKRLKKRVLNGEGGAVLEDQLIRRQGLSAREAKDLRQRVTGGMMFADTAGGILNDLENAKKKWNGPGEDEYNWARKSLASIKAVANEGAIQKVFAGSEFADAKTDSDRMDLVRKEAQRLKDEGLLGEDADLNAAEDDAYRMLVDEALEGRIGDLDKNDKETQKRYSALVSSVAKTIGDVVARGGSVEEGFKKGMKAVRDTVTGKGGREQADKFANEGSGKVNAKALASKMASAIGEQTKKGVDLGTVKLDNKQLDSMAKMKTQIDNAAYAAEGPEQAILTNLLASFEKGGGTAAIETLLENGKGVKWLESLGLADVVEELQRSDADRRQNAIGNALGLGDGTHAKAAIETSQQQMARLGAAIKKINLDQEALEAVLGGNGTEEQNNKLNSALSNAGFGNEDQKAYGRALLRSFGKNMDGGLGALYGDKLDDLNGEKYNEKWAKVTKSAAAEKSPELLQIVELLSQIVASIGMLFKNPMRVAMNGIGGLTG